MSNGLNHNYGYNGSLVNGWRNWTPGNMNIGLNGQNGMGLVPGTGIKYTETPKQDIQPNGFENFSNLGGGIMSLASAYTALKELGLMKDQLRMQRGIANRNIANSAATTNLSLANQASMAAQMMGFDPNSEQYRQYMSDPNKNVKVDGSPIR